MSSNGGGSAVAGFLALFAGCGGLLRVCSKADDVARLGKAASYADDARGLRYMDDASNLRYGDNTGGLGQNLSKIPNNTMSGEDFARAINESISDRQTVAVIDDFHETYLVQSNSSFRKEIDALNNNDILKADPYEYAIAKEDLLMKYSTESTTLARERTFRTIKTTLKLTNKLFDYVSNLDHILDLYDIIPKDSVAKINDFEVTLPKGALVAQDSGKIIWSDSLCVNQIRIMDKFDINRYINDKTERINNSQSWTTDVRGFRLHDEKTYSFSQGYSPVYGKYETITRNNETILIESMSADSLAPSYRIDKIIRDLINL